MKLRLVAGMLFCASAQALGAQTQDRGPRTADRRPQPATLKVFLITVGQGAEYWEKYGHNMLVFRDPVRRLDLAYNWGSFDFKAPDFLARQIVGDPQYWVDTVPTRLVIDFYRDRDRTIVLQRLNFTPEQASRALALAEDNLRPENRFYRYDYYLDNCSTRIRDLIDAVLGGSLKSATAVKTTAHTYRSETVRLLDDMKWAQFGVAAALGRPADRPLSEWEAGFIPMRLRDALRDVRVVGPTGTIPLVAEEQELYRSTRFNDRADAPRVWIFYLIIGVLLSVPLLTMSVMGARTPAVDVIFRVEATVWALITGALGLILVLAWTITQHVFWYGNENLLLFNPLSLWLAVLLVLSLRNPRWTRPAAVIAAIVVLMSATALILNGIPGAGQDSLALVALTLPVHLSIAFDLWRRSTITPPVA